MDYDSLLYKPALIAFVKSTSVKDKQYKPITDEIVFSLENTVPLKYNSVYEDYYRKYKFKLLSTPSSTAGLQFTVYEYDFGKSLNKLVGKVSNERTVSVDLPPPKFPVITSFTPTSGVAVSQSCLDPGPQLVYIYGENLYPASSVKFNGVEALVGTYAILNDGTEIQVFVPVGATTGKITVVTPVSTVTTTDNFTVTSSTCND